MVALIVAILLSLGLLLFVRQHWTDSDTSEHLGSLRDVPPPPDGEGPSRTAEVPQDFSMLPQEFVVLDLETTGLSPEHHEIIEFGAIHAKRDSDRHTCFQALVKPKNKLPRKITTLTGITQAMLDTDGRALEEVLPEFLAFVGDLPLVIFNASFDMRFLQRAAQQNGITITNRYTCALKAARRAWPGLPSYKLSELAKLGNLSIANSHRAVGDCERALIVFIAAICKHGKRIRWSRLTDEASISTARQPALH